MTARHALLGATLALAFAAAPARAGYLNTNAACTGANQIEVSWTFYEMPGGAVDFPAWVGYDVYRRSTSTCLPATRVNPSIILRDVGVTHSRTLLDTPPALTENFEYMVVPVDAARVRVPLGSVNCEPPCPPPTWASCPALSAPVTVGTVEDFGWALYLFPCPGSCWYGVYISPFPPELAALAGTGIPVRLYGTTGCGGIEGCGMQVDHFEIGTCPSTPTQRKSWGSVKTIYR